MERNKEIKGFVVYSSKHLRGEATEEEREFLSQLNDKLQKASKGHKNGSIKLRSFTMIFT